MPCSWARAKPMRGVCASGGASGGGAACADGAEPGAPAVPVEPPATLPAMALAMVPAVVAAAGGTMPGADPVVSAAALPVTPGQPGRASAAWGAGAARVSSADDPSPRPTGDVPVSSEGTARSSTCCQSGAGLPLGAWKARLARLAAASCVGPWWGARAPAVSWAGAWRDRGRLPAPGRPPGAAAGWCPGNVRTVCRSEGYPLTSVPAPMPDPPASSMVRLAP